jgi:hypothetical protein
MAISTSLVLKFDGAAVQRGLSSIKKSFAKVGDAIKKIGIGIGAFAITAAAGLAAAAIKINAIGESAAASDRRLQNITKQMGLFGDKSDDVSKRLLEFADAQERLTGVDTVVATQAKLMTFAELAKTADQVGGAFDRATMAAIDMAAAGFGSAEGNAVQLGKALNDPIKGIKALTKSGITFTEKQQQMITAMVETGKMGQAQNMVLKAIETQVKGTAAATSTASGRITQSFNQIVEAFAIPFSESFNGLPGILEGVFPSLIAKAEKAGRIVSSAIASAIAGDTAKLEMIGDLIAETIKVGFYSSFQSISGEILKFIANFGETNINKINKTNARINELGGTTGELLSANFATSRAPDLISALKSSTPSSISGNPPPPGFRFAREGESSIYSDASGQMVMKLTQAVEQLTGIRRSLEPTP